MNELTKNIFIPYTPLSYQWQLHNDIHRFKVLVAGRRAGKTTFSINQLIKLAVERDLPVQYWFLAPYVYQAREIGWQMLLRYLPKELWAKKPNESDLSVRLINGATIALKGVENHWGLEGLGLGGLIIDEVASIDHFSSLWENTLRPMLTDYNSPAVFISRPRGYNHFYSLAKRGDHQNIIEGESPGVSLDPDFMTFRFQTEQNCHQHYNGYLDHNEIELAKSQLTPEAFAQEYLATFTNYSGLVYRTFSRLTHVIPDFDVPHGWQRIRGWDFGSANPTATLRIAIDNDGNWFVEHCYKEKDKFIKDISEQIRTQDSDIGGNISGYGDPSARQWITELNQNGMSIIPARRQENTTEKNWVQLSIDLINDKLQRKKKHFVLLPDGRKIENAPSLFILNRPENFALVNELESLGYKESQGINNAVIDDTRDKYGHFDLHAALRYAIISSSSTISYHSVEPDVKQKEILRQKSDTEIKEILKNDEERKKLEFEEDLKIMKNETLRRGW